MLHTRAQMWTSLQVSVWQGIVISLLDGTYSAFLVPISIAFSSDLNHWSWTTIVDVVAGNISSLILVAFLYTAWATSSCTVQHIMPPPTALVVDMLALNILAQANYAMYTTSTLAIS